MISDLSTATYSCNCSISRLEPCEGFSNQVSCRLDYCQVFDGSCFAGSSCRNSMQGFTCACPEGNVITTLEGNVSGCSTVPSSPDTGRKDFFERLLLVVSSRHAKQLLLVQFIVNSCLMHYLVAAVSFLSSIARVAIACIVFLPSYFIPILT